MTTLTLANFRCLDVYVYVQVEGRTALSLALMEQREDIADLILSVEETDINNADTVVSMHVLLRCVASVFVSLPVR